MLKAKSAQRQDEKQKEEVEAKRKNEVDDVLERARVKKMNKTARAKHQAKKEGKAAKPRDSGGSRGSGTPRDPLTGRAI